MNERILWDTIEEQRVCIERLRGEVLAANAAIEAMAVALGKERTANQPAVSRDFITAWANEPGYPERVELLRAEMARLEREATPDHTGPAQVRALLTCRLRVGARPVARTRGAAGSAPAVLAWVPTAIKDCPKCDNPAACEAKGHCMNWSEVVDVTHQPQQEINAADSAPVVAPVPSVKVTTEFLDDASCVSAALLSKADEHGRVLLTIQRPAVSASDGPGGSGSCGCYWLIENGARVGQMYCSEHRAAATVAGDSETTDPIIGSGGAGGRGIALDLSEPVGDPVLRHAIACCNAWEPSVCMMGNVRAADLGDLLRELQARRTLDPQVHPIQGKAGTVCLHRITNDAAGTPAEYGPDWAEARRRQGYADRSDEIEKQLTGDAPGGEEMTKLMKILRSLAIGFASLWISCWVGQFAFPETMVWWSFPLFVTSVSIFVIGAAVAIWLVE